MATALAAVTSRIRFLSGFSIDGDGHTRLACAAPPLSLTLTGEYTVLSPPYEEDGMRAHHYF
jgi:hypothetical protein